MYNIQKYNHSTQFARAKLLNEQNCFCFCEWYGVRVCVPQSCYQSSITWRWQEVLQTVIRLGNTVKEFLISLRSTVFE